MEYYFSIEDNRLSIFVFIFIIGFFILLAFCFNVVIPFVRERNYIIMEMKRSDSSEYYFWKRKLKKLYFSHIPIIRKFIKFK